MASDTKHPYAVNDTTYTALVDLCVDICKRNGIKKLVWSTDKYQRVNHLNGCNMTVHRDYANKSCPGAYLYERHGAIAAAVNARLGVVEEVPEVKTTEPAEIYHEKLSTVYYRVRKAWTDKKSQIGAYQVLKNAKLAADKNPGTNFGKVGKFTGKGIFTIVDEADGKGAFKWGLLKAYSLKRNGWISLDYVKKI